MYKKPKSEPIPFKPSVVETDLVIQSSESTQSNESETSKSQIKIRVLNGSRTAGVAQKVADSIKELEYVEVGVGDDPEYYAEQTFIQYKSSVPLNYVDELVEKLQQDFTEVSLGVVDVGEINRYDITITTGTLLSTNL